MKKKHLRRETIRLELTGKDPRVLIRVAGPRPYINVSGYHGCIGGIPGRSIKKLKRWCEEILESRSG